MSRLDRQSFLGPDSDSILRNSIVGLVGLGGGGSHIVQQLAHMGVGSFVLVDPDYLEDTNTNRLVGCTLADVKSAMPKVDIARRTIRSLQTDSTIIRMHKSWHDATVPLKKCDIIVGALDSYIERDQLEHFSRRNIIPYIDIGMDVHNIGEKSHLISGQVFLSMPGKPCLRCCQIITDENIKNEANAYGTAGSRPQVVWPNGVLASTAVGLIAQLLTPWYSSPPDFVYLEYDGNKGTIIKNKRMELLKDLDCPHHPADEAGDPLFDIRSHLLKIEEKEIILDSPQKKSWWRTIWQKLTRN